MKQLFAYLLGVVLASLFYVTWIVADFALFSTPGVTLEHGFVSALNPTGALFLLVAGGFGAALILTSVPWLAVVWAYRRVRFSGSIYFAMVGGLLLFTVGCVTSALAPKPLFIEDNTFWGYALVTAEREGVCMFLAGVLFGYAYWFVGERRISETNASPAPVARHPTE